MSRTTHICIDVSRFLEMGIWEFNRTFEGVWTDDSGRLMSVAEVRAYLEDARAKGWRVVPTTSECVGFDYQTGCPGHEDPWDTWDEQRIERVTITGRMEDKAACIDRLRQDGWRVVVCGPYTDQEMRPRVDLARFKFIAERELGE